VGFDLGLGRGQLPETCVKLLEIRRLLCRISPNCRFIDDQESTRERYIGLAWVMAPVFVVENFRTANAQD
jgi:hypothetical protein